MESLILKEDKIRLTSAKSHIYYGKGTRAYLFYSSILKEWIVYKDCKDGARYSIYYTKLKDVLDSWELVE